MGVAHIEQLELRAHDELNQFLTGKPYKTSYGFELFRLALGEQNDVAWASVYKVYTRLVMGWVRNHAQYGFVKDDIEYVINRAFERLWRNIGQKPDKFFDFDDLAALLQYLKMCVHSAIVDDVPPRMSSADAQADTLDDAHREQGEPSHATDESTLMHNEFWQIVDVQLKDEKERVVIYEFFLWGYRDREIGERHADMFNSPKEVANKRGSVLKRLARLPGFQEILYDFIAD